jgi:hypothetical protein
VNQYSITKPAGSPLAVVRQVPPLFTIRTFCWPSLGDR